MSASSPIRKRQRIASPDRSTSSHHACARWCQFSTESHDTVNTCGAPRNEGRVNWDETKIKCFLSQDELDDIVSVRQLVDGTDITFTSRFHPLIFDHAPLERDTVRLRSLSFLGALAGRDPGAMDQYSNLSKAQKRLVGLGIRDLYLATTNGLLSDEENEILTRVADLVDETAGCTTVTGMTVSFYPCASFKVIKFIEELNLNPQDQGVLPYFAQVLDTPKLYAVFVDPSELSFHNFENIVPLDSWVEAQTASLTTELDNLTEVSPGSDIWTAKLRGADTELMKRLASLDLYAAPLNRAVRGGKRFIFHSAHLSKALTSAVAESGLITRLANGKYASSDFAFTNYVFRCNSFAPGDTKFATHRDTPYYDAARSQVSKYTLLIYLTSGRNAEGLLSVQNTTFREIEEFTCVIFDQQYEHEGRAFADTEKVFLRTELVFNDPDLSQGHHQIASLFSEACYMTGQSAFHEELERYAHESFERANSLHWGIESTNPKAQVYLYKQYHETRFLTNGYNYWFAQPKASSSLVDCATVAILDYFNCKLGTTPFRAMCRSTMVRDSITSTAEAFRCMSSREATPQEEEEFLSSPLRHLTEEMAESLFKNSPDGPFTRRPKPPWEDEDEDEDEDKDEDVNEGCCPWHAWTTFNAWNSPDVRKEYRICCKYTRKKLFGAPIMLLGQELVLNEKHVKAVGNKIMILAPDGKEMPRFNFAACWGDSDLGPEIFVDVDQQIPAPKLLIPPVVYHEYPGLGYHFVVDFFRNDWMIKVDDRHTILVPVITNDLGEVGEEWADEQVGGPFWIKVKDLVGEDENELQDTFWTRDDGDEEVSDEE